MSYMYGSNLVQKELFVQAAIRHDGTVGYFDPTQPLPPFWKATFVEDISDRMEDLRLSYVSTLKLMNQHWTKETSIRVNALIQAIKLRKSGLAMYGTLVSYVKVMNGKVYEEYMTYNGDVRTRVLTFSEIRILLKNNSYN